MSWFTGQALLFQSSDNQAVLDDPVNQDWLSVIHQINGPRWEVLARRYYLGLQHLRQQQRRSQGRGLIEVTAASKQEAMQEVLAVIEHRKKERQEAKGESQAAKVLFDASPDRTDESLPAVLRGFTQEPQSLSTILGGPGRPPCDCLCLLRAFVAAPVMGAGGGPTAVLRLLRSNPELARICGFQSQQAKKGEHELTSCRLPSQSTCEELNEVMTRYGLWSLARLEQVLGNIVSGAIEKEDTISFDTTHIEAHSHCGNVVPFEKDGKRNGKARHRKAPRMREPQPWLNAIKNRRNQAIELPDTASDGCGVTGRWGPWHAWSARKPWKGDSTVQERRKADFHLSQYNNYP